MARRDDDRRRRRVLLGGQKDGVYLSDITGIGGGSDGSTSSVVGKDWSVITGP